MEQARVSLHERSLITPLSPSPQKHLFLSASDILLRSIPYNCKVLFFRTRPERYSVLIAALKSSLSSVLVDFYPLAGRLREGEDGRLEAFCNDLGAEFVEASADGVLFSELERDKFNMKPVFAMLTQCASYSVKQEGVAPLLSIQVTRFSCGNIAIGVAHSHVIADGNSLWHFMTSWAEYTRGTPISMRPIHERTLLRVDNPSAKVAGHSVDNIRNDSDNLIKEDGEEAHTFSFSSDMIARLKGRAGGPERITSYAALCAHIWRCVSRARGHAKGTELGFASVVDMRRRMDPALPDGYFGNAVLWVMATATMRELEEEELETTAMRIRTSVTSITTSAMMALQHYLELHGTDSYIERLFVNRARIRVGSSHRFGVYNIDFGWGKPLAVRSARVEGLGKIVLYPGLESPGSVDVAIALCVSEMLKLKNDPNFIHCLASA